MNKKKELYYCNNCKQFLEKLEDLLFVEEGISRGFCGEECIEKFYGHLVVHFEEKDKSMREELAIMDEDCLEFVGKPKLMELVLSSPHEIWHVSNEIKEEYFFFIRRSNEKSIKPFYMIVTCMVYDNKPSFILAATTTRNEELVKSYRKGIKLETNLMKPADPKILEEDLEEGFQTVEIDEEMLEQVELKKSQFLAQLLEDRSPSDIPFEKFVNYDEFVPETLQNPDEVFEIIDEEGDTILTYIKAHELNGISFYYFCICMDYEHNRDEGIDTLLPILTFPSLDGEIYQIYKRGQKVTGALKN